ncbi:MAG: NADH-quinone oxidoreductase subunit C [Nitrospiraceae bacterium]|nr:NADH-quinone oxidoreductase subunit C [Nitrospiraceae bacterium]
MNPGNELYMTVESEDEFIRRSVELFGRNGGRKALRLMFAADERETGAGFNVYAVFSGMGEDVFDILRLPIRENGRGPGYKSLTPHVPAAHWYEREIADMFGIIPEGHPDSRRLVLHGMYPEGIYPLRRDVSVQDIRKKIDLERPDTYPYMKVKGEGICEIPVGPVHAGIIEPGHFRFSAVGETVYYLDPRLFYTHKGVEKHFEQIGFENGVALAERISGVSAFAHSTAYCSAVERMRGITLPVRARAARTFLLELERLYNHVGDIGNMCAGTGFAIGYARGASLKERIMRLNERLTGSRYLRGVNHIGGVSRDVLENAEETLAEAGKIKEEYKSFMGLIAGAISHIERLENAGLLPGKIARNLGATGVAARASGINDDLRTAHPYMYYDELVFETYMRTKGDVYTRMMIRADEVGCTLAIMTTILKRARGFSTGPLHAGPSAGVPPLSSALGWAEGPRGSVFYFVKSGKDGLSPLRVKVRAASFCNWPLMPFAVQGNIIPDFPLINKSFNLSYSGCDM